MILRALCFVGCIFLLAFVAFRVLVDSEVHRVVSVHALDKSYHLVDMIEDDAWSRRLPFEGSVGTSVEPDVLAMAAAIHVTAIDFFDLTGRVIGRMPTDTGHRDPGAERSDTHHAHDDHNGHSGEHGHQDDTRHGHDHEAEDGHVHDEVGNPGELSGAVKEQHEGHLHLSPEVKAILAGIRTPAAGQIRAVIDGDRVHVVEIDRVTGADGAVIHYAYTLLPLENGASEIQGAIGLILDVSHIHAAYAKGVSTFGVLFMVCGIVLFGVPALAFWLQKRLAERSSRNATYLLRHDALTGLLNRSAFVADCQEMLARDEIGYSVYIDGDRFKQINDTYGHRVGDAFLRHIAKLLTANCSSGALIARLGGDEFTVAMPHHTRADAAAILERLLHQAAEEVVIDGFTLTESISIGVAETKPGDMLDDLLQRADTALYFAKAEGRNKLAFFTEAMGAAAQRRLYLDARLREAVRNGDFDVVYQPLVDAATLQTVGYEALLRLSDDDNQPISPSEFIPIAEEIGLIEEIGTWVLRHATQQISMLDAQTRVSVNLSAEQFRSGRLVDLVRAALAEARLSPDRLELEITESILLEEATATKYQIDALKEMGVSVAMDDFGTGYSSLSTLWKYGFDRIKIDKSFVHALAEAPERSKQLIDAIVILGSRMGMSITAEGIETVEQRDILTDLGCHVLQGFLFGRPQPLRHSPFPAREKSSR